MENAVKTRFFGGGHNSLSSLSGVAPFLNFIRIAGFTLAEVLITLAIIGVVAALTFPMLLAKYQKQVTVSGLQKSYSVVTNMIRKAEAKHGVISEWSGWSADLPWYIKTRNTQDILENYLAPEAIGTKVYASNSMSGNFYVRFMCDTEDNGADNDAQYKRMDGGDVITSSNEVIQSMRLADGACVGFKPVDGNVAFVYIDINGAKKPNVVGKDFFEFILTYEGKLLPRGYELSDEDLKNNKNCPISSYYIGDCSAAKIMRAGWRITSDYNWR